MWKFKESRLSTPLIALGLTLIFGRCSLSVSDRARVTLEVEGRGPQIQNLPDQINFLSAPASVNQMDCLMLNVMGPQIPEASHLDRTSDYDFTRFRAAYAGSICSSYLGAESKLVSMADGGVADAVVPVGGNRIIQVLGMTTGGLGCPASTLSELEDQKGGWSKLSNFVPDVYEIGRVLKDSIVGDLSVTVNNSYNSA